MVCMPTYLIIDEAVEYMKISKSSFYKLVEQGKLQVIKPSRKKTLIGNPRFMEEHKQPKSRDEKKSKSR